MRTHSPKCAPRISPSFPGRLPLGVPTLPVSSRVPWMGLATSSRVDLTRSAVAGDEWSPGAVGPSLRSHGLRFSGLRVPTRPAPPRWGMTLPSGRVHDSRRARQVLGSVSRAHSLRWAFCGVPGAFSGHSSPLARALRLLQALAVGLQIPRCVRQAGFMVVFGLLHLGAVFARPFVALALIFTARHAHSITGRAWCFR